MLWTIHTYAQQVKGVVLEDDGKGNFSPLAGASIHWLGTGKGTVTDTNGVFAIGRDSSSSHLIVSYVGYTPDTLHINKETEIKVILASSKMLREVEISTRVQTSYISMLDPMRTQLINEKELMKAACCNLSESFETNPSVDVAFTDAVTGVKQIQMLGLSGIYTQITSENMPGTRGLSGYYGLGFTPGPWIEGIQLTKGAGSVANGYESMAGQINVELRKPDKADRVYFNAYQNDMGRSEANLNLNHKLNSKWSTGLLLHGSGTYLKNDFNKDGFLDIPLGFQVNAVNRWKYENNGWIAQFGVKLLNDEKTSGQENFKASRDKGDTLVYGVNIRTQRYEGFGKVGYVFPQKKYKSIGLMVSAMNHNQDAYFGITTYNGKQQTLYGNLIYQSIIGNSFHKFRTGISSMTDVYDEHFNQRAFKRTEYVTGAFYEYTYTHLNRYDIVVGLRGDYHNMFGFIPTPRIHAKYNLSSRTVLRASVGRGFRTANIFAENTSIFVSSRQLVLDADTNNANRAYGLKPEISWTSGISLAHEFKLNGRDGNIVVDFYRSDFENQVVIDLDKNPQQVWIYNLQGRSYSNSAQAEVNYEIFKRFDVRVAYRWLDVKTTYHGMMLQKPLLSEHRAFVNLAYETRSKWKFDYTISWNGAKRIPQTTGNPAELKVPAVSPDFIQMHAQVSKTFNKHFDAYIGMENITDYRQKNLIVEANNPFGRYFDASLVWGPVVGRMTYVGIRYKLK